MIELADDKLIETRMIICQGCRSRKDNLIVGSTCGKLLMPSYGFISSIIRIFNKEYQKGKRTCGCALNLKWKLLNYHCPQKKW